MAITLPPQPWSSRWAATCWLTSDAKHPVSADSMQRAAETARKAAGPAATATRTLAFEKQEADTALALKQLHAALISLRSTEREARRWAKPLSLREAVAFPPARCAHWPLMREVERTISEFESAFQAARRQAAKRAAGERASNESAAASNRYVIALFGALNGRPGKPHDLAITEIAVGRASPCQDAAEFSDRCKRWSKVRAARNPPEI